MTEISDTLTRIRVFIYAHIAESGAPPSAERIASGRSAADFVCLGFRQHDFDQLLKRQVIIDHEHTSHLVVSSVAAAASSSDCNTRIISSMSNGPATPRARAARPWAPWGAARGRTSGKRYARVSRTTGITRVVFSSYSAKLW